MALRVTVFATLLFFSIPAGVIAADDSPKYAERGVMAYHSGKHDLARLFFAKALQDAILKGKEEWIIKATMNLVDVELESGEDGEVARLLKGLSPKDKDLRALVLWKRSQAAFNQRRVSEAIALADSALKGFKENSPKVWGIRLDRLRYLIHSRQPEFWNSEYSALKLHSGKVELGRIAGLEALASMAKKDFVKADSFWVSAMNFYREQGRLAMVAACLNQRSLCLFASGNRLEALEVNTRAVSIYSELGLKLMGLRAQALRLLLLEESLELAKLRQDMDLLGQKFSGFDLQGILDEYSQSMHIDRIDAIGPGR